MLRSARRYWKRHDRTESRWEFDLCPMAVIRRCTLATAPRHGLRRPRRGRPADHEVGGGDRPRAGAGAAGRRLHRRPADPDVLPRRAAALRRHQHLPQGAVRRGRPPLRRVRRRRARRPVRRRHHLPLGHPLRPAGHPQDLRALRAVQLRAGRRPARDDHDRRPRRHLHDPRQHREDVRPDHQGRLARLRQRRVPRRARRRPLDRLPDHPRRRPAPQRRQPRDHPLRPARRHPGDRPRRADAHHALVPRHGHPQRARRRTSCRSASAAGRRPGPG